MTQSARILLSSHDDASARGVVGVVGSLASDVARAGVTTKAIWFQS